MRIFTHLLLVAAILAMICTMGIAKDDFIGSRLSRFKDMTYDFRLTRAAVEKAPKWQADADAPPLPPARAYKIALDQAVKLRPEVKIWGTKAIYLDPVWGRSGAYQDQDWVYLTILQDMSGPIAGRPWEIVIPVYMDGSTIDPVITKNK